MWNEIVRDICCVSVFAYLAVRDRREMELSRRELSITGIVLFLAGFLSGAGIESRLAGLAYGAIVVVFCIFSKEALGVADGIIILVYGVAFGLYEAAAFSFLAMVAAALVSVVLLVIRRAERKTRLPFFPFLLFGYILMRVFVYSM